MSFRGFGHEDLFDFNGDGKLDLFETALMMDEQDREMNEMFGHDRSSPLDDDDDDDLDTDEDSDLDDELDF